MTCFPNYFTLLNNNNSIPIVIPLSGTTHTFSQRLDYLPFIKTWKDREIQKSHYSAILIAIIVIPGHTNVAALQNTRFG